MTVTGMDCSSCVTGLSTKLQRLRGVEAVAVLAEKGLVTLKLAAGNKVQIDRVRDEIKAVGFNPRDARVTVTGRAVSTNGKMLFTPDGSTVAFVLSGAAVEPAELITIEGTQPVPATPQDALQIVVISAKRD